MMTDREEAFLRQVKELDTVINDFVATISTVYADALHLKQKLENKKIEVPPEVQRILTTTYNKLENVNGLADGVSRSPDISL